MPPQLPDLVTPLTVDEVRLAIFNVLAAIGVTTTNWRPGAVVRTMITAFAIVGSSLSQLISLIARAGWLELSFGSWLTLVARYVYGVERIAATFATGYVTLTNTDGGNYDVDPNDLTVSNPITGKEYQNTAFFSLPSGSTIVIPVQAVEQGSSSTSFAGEITVVQSSLDGVSVYNSASVAGYDEETDQSLKIRCSDKLGSLSDKGPKDAYGYAARSAKRADGTNIGVTRVAPKRLPNGVMSVYVAGAAGPISGSVSDPNSDLGRVNEAIQRAAPLGITVNTYTVSTSTVDVSFKVWLYNTTSMSRIDIHNQISSSLQSFIAAQPIGGNVIAPDVGKVFLSGVETAIAQATDLSGAKLPLFKVEVLAPSADVPLALDAVAVLGDVASVVNIVPVTGV
jgi:phage-related baseplate assembly protein